MNPEAQQDVSVSQRIRMMFYMMKPNETSFQILEEVPDYVKQATPFFISLMLLELVISWILKGKPPGRLDDALTSISAGVFSRLPSLFSRSIELTTYIYVWENYRLINLPWDSPWTWYLTFLGVDFGYYWFHRMAHECCLLIEFYSTDKVLSLNCPGREIKEVNIMWAGHQTHHSSEDYNLSTALRQSVLQIYTSWMFYSPLALFIPPSVYAVHLQFNLLYQFWIHTEVINNLGPLELIINTPSHHRVHHGRNRYCIDKNYAGVLIIWDRIFGTFEAENEKVVYGLTHPINTFEPFQVQVTGKEVPFSSSVSHLLKIYAVVQFALMLAFYEETFADKAALSQATLLLRVCFIILTLTSIGFLLDQRPKAAVLETFRCLVFLMLYRIGHLKPLIPSLSFAFEIFFSICIAFWGVRSMKQLASSPLK
ncbi:alkylglycerol monooxygenase isoform X12 [Canis lupus familiaris]|uniref:alkylglycerol monooxygenase isoform X12 n=1 Tax=Canis lupus familiaris TaxID=9615 RepID=UPI0018F2EE18|nr:alkylglycerol monooxygenase isoform X12 [Canis lupus familiaris]